MARPGSLNSFAAILTQPDHDRRRSSATVGSLFRRGNARGCRIRRGPSLTAAGGGGQGPRRRGRAPASAPGARFPRRGAFRDLPLRRHATLLSSRCTSLNFFSLPSDFKRIFGWIFAVRLRCSGIDPDEHPIRKEFVRALSSKNAPSSCLRVSHVLAVQFRFQCYQ
jgi:hypothetical protein